MEKANYEVYVSQEVAKLLEEAGFDWWCKYAYITTPEGEMPTEEDGMFTEYVENVNWLVKAPTLEVAQRWLREIKKLHITIFSMSQESWMFRVTNPYQKIEEGAYGEDFYSYEEAQEAGIKKTLEMILDKIDYYRIFP